MNKFFILAWCIALLTSCETDNSDYMTEGYGKQIVNTGWELTEVMDHNNAWQSAELYQTLDLREIWFQSGNHYTMRFRNLGSYEATSYVMGTYRIENGTILMTDNRYQGIAYQLKIIFLTNDILECDFTVWSGLTPIDPRVEPGNASLQDRRYTIRMKRFKQ